MELAATKRVDEMDKAEQEDDSGAGSDERWRECAHASAHSRIAKFIQRFSVCCLSRASPAGRPIETLGARTGIGTEPEVTESAREQPFDHRIVQRSPVSSTFMLGVDKKRPDVSGIRVTDCEPDDSAVVFNHPSASRRFDRREVVLFGDHAGAKPVLAHRKAYPVHPRNVFPARLSQDGHAAKTIWRKPLKSTSRCAAMPSVRATPCEGMFSGRMSEITFGRPRTPNAYLRTSSAASLA